MKYLGDVRCIRLNQREIRITWESIKGIEVKIYSSIEKCEDLIGRVKDKGEFNFKQEIYDKRCIFILKAEGYNPEYIGESLIPLKGCNNFRDLGGYKTVDGRHIKWNTFFRGGNLSNLTVDDTRYFKELGIKTILDLRSRGEVKASPNVKIEGVKYINISAMKSLDYSGEKGLRAFINKIYSDKDKAEKFLIEGYREMVSNNKALKEVIDIIESGEETPILFHCTQGKDRTGIVASLIMAILGVPMELILADYLKSNEYRKEEVQEILNNIKVVSSSEKSMEILKILLYVKKEYLEEFYKEIINKFNSFDKYLEKEFSISKTKRKELKKRYLY